MIEQGLPQAFAALRFIHINADFGADVISGAGIVIAESGPSQNAVLLITQHHHGAMGLLVGIKPVEALVYADRLQIGSDLATRNRAVVNGYDGV